jgi:hypothetical protein
MSFELCSKSHSPLHVAAVSLYRENTAAAYCRYFSSFLSAEFADSHASEKIELGQSNALYCSMICMIHWLGGWMDGWVDGWMDG